MFRAGDIIGPYTLIDKIGRGSFGVVWLAERRGRITTTKVAVKFPLDEDVDLEAIKREADLWVEACGHPNVLTLYEADIYDDQPVIVSEYAPDGSLRKWLARHNGRAPSHGSAVEMMGGILSGLSHLHRKRIIHRDLKPDNVLLQGETPRLADFGIARVLKTSQSSIIGGTYAYMAPEAFRNERSEQVDVWAAGVIFYQMLAGRLPFSQADAASLMHAIINAEPEPLPEDVPAGLREVVSDALSKDAARRYKTAAAMRAKLKEAATPPAPKPDNGSGVVTWSPQSTPFVRIVNQMGNQEATLVGESPPFGNVVYISNENFEREVLRSGYLVVLLLTAQWDASNKLLSPAIQALAENYAGRVKVASLDVDYSPAVSQRCGIKRIPTIIFFYRGKEEERIVGATSREALSRVLDKILS